MILKQSEQHHTNDSYKPQYRHSKVLKDKAHQQARYSISPV